MVAVFVAVEEVIADTVGFCGGARINNREVIASAVGILWEDDDLSRFGAAFLDGASLPEAEDSWACADVARGEDPVEVAPAESPIRRALPSRTMEFCLVCSRVVLGDIDVLSSVHSLSSSPSPGATSLPRANLTVGCC